MPRSSPSTDLDQKTNASFGYLSYILYGSNTEPVMGSLPTGGPSFGDAIYTALLSSVSSKTWEEVTVTDDEIGSQSAYTYYTLLLYGSAVDLDNMAVTIEAVPVPVPAPAAVLLLGGGLAALAGLRPGGRRQGAPRRDVRPDPGPQGGSLYGAVPKGLPCLVLLLFLAHACAHTPSGLDTAQDLYIEGQDLLSRGQPAEAMARFTESLALCRASNDREGKAHNLNEIGILLTQQGQTARARASFREALHIYRSLGKAPGVSKTLNNLAATHVLDKDRTGAVRVYRELLAWDEEIDITEEIIERYDKIKR